MNLNIRRFLTSPPLLAFRNSTGKCNPKYHVPDLGLCGDSYHFNRALNRERVYEIYPEHGFKLPETPPSDLHFMNLELNPDDVAHISNGRISRDTLDINYVIGREIDNEGNVIGNFVKGLFTRLGIVHERNGKTTFLGRDLASVADKFNKRGGEGTVAALNLAKSNEDIAKNLTSVVKDLKLQIQHNIALRKDASPAETEVLMTQYYYMTNRLDQLEKEFGTLFKNVVGNI